MSIIKSIFTTIAILVITFAISYLLIFLNIEYNYSYLVDLAEFLPNLIAYSLAVWYLYKSTNELNKTTDKTSISRVLLFNIFFIAIGLQIIDIVFVFWKNISNTYFNTSFLLSENHTYESGVTQACKLFNAVIISSFFEEIIFRFYLFGGLLKRYSFLTATLISSLMFSIIHIGNPRSIIPSFYFGLLSALVYYKSKNIFYSILFHFIYNLMWALSLIFAKEYNQLVNYIGFGSGFFIVILLGIGILFYGTRQVQKVKSA